MVRDRFWPYERMSTVEADRSFVNAINTGLPEPCMCRQRLHRRRRETRTQVERQGVPIAPWNVASFSVLRESTRALINNGGGPRR